MASLAAESPLSSDVGSRHNLPPLIETFPSDKYPIREIGGGFTAQSVRGVEADACAETAAEMMTEARTMSVSNVSSDNGSMGPMVEGEFFPVPELPRPEDATQDGILIMRNERLFPGMVAISLPLHGILWVREDGTFNLSGFFRRQIPKFETAALLAATADMKEFLDVYHVFYSPVLEAAAARRQFNVMRKVLEAGMRYYVEPDGPARKELKELRRRVVELRAQSNGNGNGTGGQGAAAGGAASSAETSRQSSWMSAESIAEMQGSPSAKSDKDAEGRRSSGGSGEMTDDGSEKGRSSRSSSGQGRSIAIAQQVMTGAPKQKTPFRLWKTETGKEGYDKSKPS